MLTVNDLRVTAGQHELLAVDHFELPAKRRLGVVGESGSGKTMMVMSIAGLQPRGIRVTGSVSFAGRELVNLDEREMAKVHGGEIGIIFQDPNRALNPTMRIGKQVAEAIRLHSDMEKDAVRQRVIELLGQVHLKDPESLLRRYPHQLSGGQQQRVMIAIAISSRPRLLIADEPTTALDVTVQKGILQLLVQLSEEQDMALIFVSHDLGVVKSVSEHIAVMYGGRLVESGVADEVLANPRHRYTEALIGANPGLGDADEMRARLGRRLRIIDGSVPAVGSFPDGCRFRGRCGSEVDECQKEPPITELDGSHWFKCWNPTSR